MSFAHVINIFITYLRRYLLEMENNKFRFGMNHEKIALREMTDTRKRSV